MNRIKFALFAGCGVLFLGLLYGASYLQSRASVRSPVTPPIQALTSNITITKTDENIEVPPSSPTSTDTPSPTSTPFVKKTLQPENYRLTQLVLPMIFSAPASNASISSPIECLSAKAERLTAKVTRVYDGDTIEVSLNGKKYTVRYIGIDSPEEYPEVQAFAAEAKAGNLELVGDQTVTLIKDVSEIDRYGRLLRYVLVGEKFVNYELVRQGFASAATYPPDVACADTFMAAEQVPKTNMLGLWSPELATPATLDPTVDEENQIGNSAASCDPHYPSACIPPPPPDLDCKDITDKRFQVLPPDPHYFDGDHDGVGCER